MNPVIKRLLSADPSQRRAILSALSPEEMVVIYKELDAIEKAPKRRWYCERVECDGNPHAGFHWCEHDINGKHTPFCKHARTAQRPPKDDPDHPWLVWFFSGGRGVGKALDVATPVPTPTGWTTMGELKVGDKVFSADGSVTTVTFVTGYQHDRQCYRIKFHDGAEIVADAEHQWTARSRADRRAKRPYRTVTTADMVKSVRCANGSNWQIPMASSLELPEQELPIHPWVFGFWLGDGSSNESAVTIGDSDAQEILGLLEKFGEPHTGKPRRKEGAKCATYPIGKSTTVRDAQSGQMLPNGSLHTRLRELGVMGNKHIPQEYLRGSRQQREHLLAGIIDADGHLNPSKGNAIEITTVKKHLAEQYAELVRSLGYRTKISVGRATINGVDKGEKYRIWWTANDGGGMLQRKKVAPLHGGGQPQRIRTRYVASIEPVESRPVCCISVDNPSHLYLAGKEMIVTHNTRSGAEWVLDLVWNQGYKRIALIGRTPADVRDVMIYGDSGIMSCSDPHPRPSHEPTKRRLIWENGAQAFTYSAAAPSQLRGPQHDAAWGDEIAAWTDAPKGDSLDTSYNNLMLGLRLGMNPKALFTSTPKRVRLVREIMERRTTVITNGTTYENLDNLAPSFRESVLQAYEGTRIGQQELMGVLMTDVDGALFTLEMIDANRGVLALPDPDPDDEFYEIEAA